LESKDDYFLLNSGLVVIETSLTIFNKTLYQALQPCTVPVWARVQVANRLAVNASQWVDIFSLYNSGTHNNEWIVTDYNKYWQYNNSRTEEDKLHHNNAAAAFTDVVWLLDQIPGYIESADISDLVYTQGYIASYNIPFFQNLMNITGYAQNGFNYYNDTRAQIFRRDQSNVTDLDSMSYLMNLNDYQNDPLAQGNPCNQISARCDLAGDAFGGIDSKNVNSDYVRSQRTLTIGAPSHLFEPDFVWTQEYASVSHVGMPEVFNFNWTDMYPAF
jgi:hypothetical protein